jgi:hypothetical protein
MKLWLVYEDGCPVEFHGLFRLFRDAVQARDVQQENLRASGTYSKVLIEPFAFQPGAKWSD